MIFKLLLIFFLPPYVDVLITNNNIFLLNINILIVGRDTLSPDINILIIGRGILSSDINILIISCNTLSPYNKLSGLILSLT